MLLNGYHGGPHTMLGLCLVLATLVGACDSVVDCYVNVCLPEGAEDTFSAPPIGPESASWEPESFSLVPQPLGVRTFETFSLTVTGAPRILIGDIRVEPANYEIVVQVDGQQQPLNQAVYERQPGEPLVLGLFMDPPADALASDMHGTLCATILEPDLGQRCVTLSFGGFIPQFVLSPARIDFGDMPRNTTVTREVCISSDVATTSFEPPEPLTLTYANNANPFPEIELIAGSNVWPAPSDGRFTIEQGVLPCDLNAAASFPLTLRYTTATENSVQRSITLSTTQDTMLTIPLLVNSGIACFNVSTQRVLFDNAQTGVAQTRAVTFENCGSQPVEFNASLGPGSSPSYTLPTGQVVGTLMPGATEVVEITLTPTDVATRAEGTLQVTTDLPAASDYAVTLFSDALSAACPEVTLRGERLDGQGGTFTDIAVVPPETSVRLLAQVLSNPAGGAITYRWATLNEPEDGRTRFLVNRSTDASVIVTPPVTGIYTFRLDVVNRLGVSACAPAEIQLDVFAP